MTEVFKRPSTLPYEYSTTQLQPDQKELDAIELTAYHYDPEEVEAARQRVRDAAKDVDPEVAGVDLMRTATAYERKTAAIHAEAVKVRLAAVFAYLNLPAPELTKEEKENKTKDRYKNAMDKHVRVARESAGGQGWRTLHGWVEAAEKDVDEPVVPKAIKAELKRRMDEVAAQAAAEAAKKEARNAAKK